ncbi:unnamed protein product [Mytilus coruscus]|uniref:Farnesoic acid O-methyl transferase domain-containing protein n=1 Tax=Mytilus coruscus TaxID=42192 RepID=A0A6J8BWY6_MYTCO|nr:unnamed protein product [Mytilus coruscus]
MVRVLLIMKCLLSVGTATQLSLTTTANGNTSILLADTGVFRSEYKSFLFSVKGCRDARLKLLSHETEVRQHYEVLIGGWSNTKSTLHMKIKDVHTIMDECNSSEMDCDVYKQFWISWDQVGRATQLSVTTTANGNTSILLADTGVFRSEYKSFLFSVKGCRDARLKLLSHETEVRQHYEVLIGGWGNTKSTLHMKIKDVHTIMDECNSSEMDCDVYKQFWISWDQGLIKVGRGNAIGDDVFLLYKDRCSFSIKNIQISNGEIGNPGLAQVDWIMYSTPFINDTVPIGNGYRVNVFKKMVCSTISTNAFKY